MRTKRQMVDWLLVARWLLGFNSTGHCCPAPSLCWPPPPSPVEYFFSAKSSCVGQSQTKRNEQAELFPPELLSWLLALAPAQTPTSQTGLLLHFCTTCIHLQILFFCLVFKMHRFSLTMQCCPNVSDSSMLSLQVRLHVLYIKEFFSADPARRPV